MGGDIIDRDILEKDILDFSCLECAPTVTTLSERALQNILN